MMFDTLQQQMLQHEEFGKKAPLSLWFKLIKCVFHTWMDCNLMEESTVTGLTLSIPVIRLNLMHSALKPIFYIL